MNISVNIDVKFARIPKQNLLTGQDNEIQYYDKIADELIRYNRIKNLN